MSARTQEENAEILAKARETKREKSRLRVNRWEGKDGGAYQRLYSVLASNLEEKLEEWRQEWVDTVNDGTWGVGDTAERKIHKDDVRVFLKLANEALKRSIKDAHFELEHKKGRVDLSKLYKSG